MNIILYQKDKKLYELMNIVILESEKHNMKSAESENAYFRITTPKYPKEK